VKSVCVTDQMAFAARFSPVGRIGTCLPPPKTARIEQLSTTVRDQSICPQRASQSSNTKWIISQIPASCQSRNRRQQVQERRGAVGKLIKVAGRSLDDGESG